MEALRKELRGVYRYVQTLPEDGEVEREYDKQLVQLTEVLLATCHYIEHSCPECHVKLCMQHGAHILAQLRNMVHI